MRIALACLALAACSSPTPRAKPPSQHVVRTPVSSLPTCADMGPLLRGPMDDEDHEGPEKEALIVASCERDRWPAAVIECAASATEPTVQDCLEHLPAEMHARYTKALAKYDPDETEMPVEEEATCGDALAATAVDVWSPPVVTEAERSLATKLRFGPLLALCHRQSWALDIRTCIVNTPAVRTGECLDGLDDAEYAEVKQTIEAADELRAKIVKARAKPTTVTCDKAVAVHYATAKWTGKAPELKGADRTKAIAASKKAMLTACKAGWSIELRACLVAEDSDACHALGGSPAWGYPAAAATSKMVLSGIAECDAYALAVEALARCPSLPADTTKQMMEAYEQASAGWSSLPPEAIEAVKMACKTATDATLQAAVACT